MKKALLTGITGQDGSYLAEFLLGLGYEVHGFAREDSWYQPHCASHLSGKVSVHFGNIEEGVDIARALQVCLPDEVYHLASQSRPGLSWIKPTESLITNGLGTVRLFEAVRHICPEAKVYHASSSDMFGPANGAALNESSNFNPTNPYSASKVYAHNMAKVYRDSYSLFIAIGILFNHESERRPLHFLVQKVAHGAACAALGIQNSPFINERGRPIVNNGLLALGNLDISRDWGYASDFVRAMWLMLQEEKPDEYVIGTGQLHSLVDLCEAAYGPFGIDFRKHVTTDASLARPNESGGALADPRKAQDRLGWNIGISFREMVKGMVDAQIRALENF